MRSRWTEIVIHFAVWLALIFIPLFLQLEDNAINMRMMSRVWVMLLCVMVTFYSNYLWGIDRLLLKRHYILFIVFNLLIFMLTRSFDMVFNSLFDIAASNKPRHMPTAGMRSVFVYNDIIFFALGVGASLGLSYAKRLSHSEMERKRLETEKLESEISLLKYQMQPHFFFNTLNNIYSLIGKSPAEAQKAVHTLSKMMRYILYENTPETISLRKEIEFMQNYSQLMRLRVNEDVRVELNFPDTPTDIAVPPLLFIPLLENAFKHGTAGIGQHFITCQMHLDDQQLEFIVENSISPRPDEDRSRSGIGIANLRKRLEILFGQGYVFTAEPNNEHTVFTSRLVIPIKQ